MVVGFSYAENNNLISSDHDADFGIDPFNDSSFNSLNKSCANNYNKYHTAVSFNKSNAFSSNEGCLISSNVSNAVSFNEGCLISSNVSNAVSFNEGCLISSNVDNAISCSNFKSIGSNGISVFAIGDEIYVSTSGDDGNDGYSPETAKKTIANALITVNNGGTIFILGGTYTGTGNIGLTINKNVTIIGNTTVQDVILDGQNTNQRVMTIGNNVNLQIQNIKFTNARTTGSGAVIYATSGTAFNVNITLNNCSFTNNYAANEGGVIYLSSGTTASRTNLTVINCIFTNNTANTLYGGAISVYYGNLIYIENSSFNNNTATYSGAIETNQIDTTMINSNFTGNKATTAWGGVMNHDSGTNIITVMNCIFINNSCRIDGGVFRVSGLARLNVNDSVFINNFAGNDTTAEGGAIYSEGGIVTVRNSNFTNNGAYLRGGAIGSYSFLSNAGLFIYGCNFVGNYVTQTSNGESSNTILIWGTHQVEINYNRFYNNSGSPNNYVIFVHDALSNADLSYNWWGDNRLPIANTLALNKITNYFVIDVLFDSISGEVAKFNYVIRLNNNGSFDLNRLPNFYGNFSTSPSFINGNFVADRSGSINISLNGNSGNITFNFSVDDWNKSITIFVKTNTTLILYPIPDTIYGSNVIINGILLDENGNPIGRVPITLTINGVNYIVVTETNGTFSLVYTVNDTGIIDVIGEFYGTDEFLATSNITSFNVIPINTSIIIDPIPDTKVGETVVINGTLIDSQGIPLSNLTVDVLINGFLYSVITNEDGKFNVSYIVDTSGIIVVMVQFPGNNRYNASFNTISFNGLSINTKIIIDAIDNTKVGNTIIITGKLLDEYDQPIANANLIITINDFDYFVQTNSSGGFTLSYTVNITGNITVFVYYGGNETYLQSSNSITFLSSRINTVIIVDSINDTKIGSIINITGTLVDEYGQIIANANITIFIDGFNYDVTTDISGRFVLTYLVNITGNISVFFQYDGNNRYNPSTNITYFNSSKINTNIIVDDISDTRIGNNVSIGGTLVDEDGNPIANNNITVIINGSSYVILTDNGGKFGLNYTVNSSGSITVIYQYLGSAIYMSSFNTTTFQGLKIETIIIIDNIPDTPIGNSVNITGNLVDEDGIGIVNATITIVINGNSYTVTTNSSGGFTLAYNVTSSGPIGILYIYEGNDVYGSSNNFTSFNGFAINTTIIVDNIPDTKIGNNVTISGRLVDQDGNGIANANITIIIDGFSEIVITNSTGGFSLNYIISRSDTISVIFAYNGNNTYNPSSNNTSFKGLKIDTIIIIDNINNTKIGNNVIIRGTLIDENNNSIANVNITIIIDGVSRDVVTDSSGKFSLNFTVNNSGIILVFYEYNGNETFNPSSNQTSFEGLKLATQIIITNISDTRIGNNVTISGTLFDENGQAIANANLIITINDFDYFVQTNSSGGFTLTYTVNITGNITVFVYYGGNETYLQSFNSTTFLSSRINTVIIVDSINDTKIGSIINITGTLVDEYGQIIANANITIFIDGFSYDVTTDSFGKFSLSYIVDKSGIILVFYEYDGNETFNPSSNQTNFEGLKLYTQIIIDNISDTKIGNTVTITGVLVDENGQTIANAQVNLYIEGYVTSILTDVNGRFSFNYILNKTGNIIVVLTYAGGDNFEPAINETSFTGLRLNTSIIFDPINNTKINDTVVISGTLVDEYNRPVPNARINVIVAGFLYVDLTDENGRFSFNYPVSHSVTINVLGTFPGTDVYAPSANITFFNGLALETNIIFDNIGNVTINDTILISGTLVDENNNPVANVNITLTINGTDYVVLTDLNGKFSINYFVGNEAGLFIVNGVFNGTLEYDYSYNSTSFTVNKIFTNLTIPNISGIVGDEVNITAILTDRYGNKLVGKNITFYIENNGFYVYIGIVATDINGVATIQYNISKIGSYKILGVFLEDDIYSGSNATGLAIFSVGKTNITVENSYGSVGDTIDLTAKLTDRYGNPLVNKVVDFYVDGVYVGSSLTNINGIAKYSYLITAIGNYTIKAVFKGDIYADPSEGIGFGIFTAGETNLEVYDVTGSVGDTVNLTAKLTDRYGNPLVNKVVDFYVDGRYLGFSVTNIDGVTNYLYIITNAGNHIIRAVFKGDSNLHSSEGIGFGIFTAGETNLEVYDVTGSVGDTVNLTAKLYNNHGKPITNKVIDFYVDGVYIGFAVTNFEGIAKYPYSITSGSNHTIRAVFKGDSNLYSSEGIGFGIFTPGETNLEIYDINAKVGDKVYLKTKLTDKNGKPITNKTVDFYINGKYIGSAITDSDGVAKLRYLIFKERFILTTIFAGDSDYLSSEDDYEFIGSKGNKSSNFTSNTTSNFTSEILTKPSLIVYARMKETGLPLIAILVLITGLGLFIRKKILKFIFFIIFFIII